MDAIDLLLVGCGLMGGRHLRGYAALERVRPGSIRLRAVCDPAAAAGHRVAAAAEELLGYRPRVFSTASEALQSEPEIVAADVVTDPRSHGEVILPLLEARLHVQVEKPLAVTVARGRELVRAARHAGRILSVAENYRRDPMNRLLRHTVVSGAIGVPHMLLELHAGEGRRVVVSPWRHAWRHGGLALDVGVHYADMLEYLLGPVATVFTRASRVRTTREWTPGDAEATMVPVECDDLYSAVLTFESGAQGIWMMNYGSDGQSLWQRTVFGSESTVNGPPDRTGRPVRLQRGQEAIEGPRLVAELPGFRLEGVEALLFGDRPASCELPFQEMDARLIAAETGDFLDAVRESREPEVNGELGLRSVAVVMAMLESAHSEEPVSVDRVLSGEIRDFQDSIIGR